MVKYGKKMKKPAAPLMPLHKYSLEYEKSKQQANEKRLQLLDEATAYCIENGAQPKDAVKLKRFESLTKDQIRYHMTRSARNERDILTNTERDRVFEWMKKRSDEGDEPVTESMLGEEILKILKARLADNRARNHNKALGCVKLSKAERCLVQQDKPPSHIWLQKLKAAAANQGIDYKTCKTQDSKRQKKQNEGTVNRHFNGAFGLEAELLSVGNLDPETRRIKDPRRLLNCDEMPQFLAYIANGKLQRAFGRKGVKLQTCANENRECATLMTAADLSGFLYGLQVIVSRKHARASWADCCDVPEWGLSFADEKILLGEGKATYGMISPNEKGMQTKETFMEFLRFLVEQIKARSEAEVAAGKPPIEFPVTLMLDNHSSRFGEEILEACSEDAAGLGISLFFEESMSSHILQMLDKIFEKLHKAYRQGLKEYKKQWEST